MCRTNLPHPPISIARGDRLTWKDVYKRQDADGADGSVGGRDGESESDGYDELGSEDEQYPEPGSGDRDGGGRCV